MKLLPFEATQLDLEGIMLSEITQTEKDECINHLYMKPKKYNKPVNTTKKQQTHKYREQTNGYQWGEERDREATQRQGIKKYKLLGRK